MCQTQESWPLHAPTPNLCCKLSRAVWLSLQKEFCSGGFSKHLQLDFWSTQDTAMSPPGGVIELHAVPPVSLSSLYHCRFLPPPSAGLPSLYPAVLRLAVWAHRWG